MLESLVERSGAQATFILDTNVLLYDPRALFVFKEHDVIIPITVIEEVDRFKKDLNETGRNARLVSRYMDRLREQGSLSDGVILPDGGRLRVELGRPAKLPRGLRGDSGDNLILQTVKALHDDGSEVILVTRDTNMRLKADAMGIRAEDYRHAHIAVDEYYSGVSAFELPQERVDELYEKGSLPREAVEQALNPNEFLLLGPGGRHSAMARYMARRGRLKLVGRYKEGVWGIRARNKEQLFALELLLDDSLSLVTIEGLAGTGKTLLAMACGLQKVADEKRYRRLLVSRPIFPMGRDLGFLPGDINEKLNPWMKPIFDNLEVLLSSPDGDPRGSRPGAPPTYQPLLDQGILEVEPLTYIRGRSLPRQFVVIDEAQNLTPHEVKTVITRAGEGTKVILTGDPNQIDNPYVDATSNGLTYVVERFKGSPIAGHITLRKGERSELAQQAAELL